jgi:hypothetical protein
MRLTSGAVVVTLTLAICTAPAAFAATPTNDAPPGGIDQTNTNYRSNIVQIVPNVPGMSLQVLDYNDELVLTNHSGRPITMLGYSDEPYMRILGDGTVQVNMASPAYYLNQSFYGNVTVPASASSSFAPHWSTVDKTGTYQWHDHRIHWMSPTVPPQVKNKSKKTKIFDWRVPFKVSSQPGTVYGNLYWVGQPGGFPLWALISLIIVVPSGLIGTYLIQRRRFAHEPEEGAVPDKASATAQTATQQPGEPGPHSEGEKEREAW